MAKVALVYDWLDTWGGAERVLITLRKKFPNAPLYTSFFNPRRAPWAKNWPIVTSFLQKTPLKHLHHRFLAPFLPLAFESFNFDAYDLVISVSSFAAKGIITKPKTQHINYLLTPTRFLWLKQKKDYPFFRFCRPLFSYLRRWDFMAAQRPDKIIAISQTVARRCQKYYHRRAEKVIYPSVNTKKFFSGQKQEEITKHPYFLLVSRLEPHKKVSLAIEAFNQLQWPLKIIGTGSEEKKLKKQAKKNIQFLGHLTDKKLLRYYQRCQALIFPQEEDFGLVSLEAQACGRPVIAFGRGGAKETIKAGETGFFFYPQTATALIKVLLKFSSQEYSEKIRKACLRNAQRFSEKNFLKQWGEVLKNYGC